MLLTLVLFWYIIECIRIYMNMIFNIKQWEANYGGVIMRQVVIYSGENGYWVAECTSLPGVSVRVRLKKKPSIILKKQ